MMDKADKAVRHSVTIIIYEDDSLDFKFINAETLPAGKLERWLMKAVRALKHEQGQIRHKQREKLQKEQAAADVKAKEEAEKQARLDAIERMKADTATKAADAPKPMKEATNG